MSKVIDTKDKIKALIQWITVLPLFGLGIIGTFLLGWLVILTAKRQPENPFGLLSPQFHRDKYLRLKSSGTWYYFMTTVPILKWFGNFEDGLYGEPSGKNSAYCKGREKTFLNMYSWLMRNPFNYAKRNTPMLACFVNECTIVYRGDETLNDKKPDGAGRHWVIATHNSPKWWHWKKYYSFRQVIMLDDSPKFVKFYKLLSKLPYLKESYFTDVVVNISLGYKLKPEHGEVVQVEDDRDKAFTFRVQVKRGQWVWEGGK